MADIEYLKQRRDSMDYTKGRARLTKQIMKLESPKANPKSKALSKAKKV